MADGTDDPNIKYCETDTHMQWRLLTAAWWVLHVLTIPQTCPSTYLSYILVKRRQVWEWCGKTEMKSRVFHLNRSSWYDADEVLRWDTARTPHQTSITCFFFATCQGNHISIIRNLIVFCTQPDVTTPHKSSHSLAESFIDILFYCQTRALSGFATQPQVNSNLSTCLNKVKSERLEYSGPRNYFCDVWLQSHRAAGYRGNMVPSGMQVKIAWRGSKFSF